MNALSRAEYSRDRLAVTADAYRSIDQAKCQERLGQFRGKPLFSLGSSVFLCALSLPSWFYYHPVVVGSRTEKRSIQ